MPTSILKLNSVVRLVSQIWKGSKIKCGTAHLPKRPLADKFLYGGLVPANSYQRTKFKLPNSITFGLYPKMGFWGFEGDVKILCSNPQKALPCVNTRLLVYRVSKSVQRPKG